ncbi:hypothetical protein FRB94_009196 [Tulasnella sp. JGI-2019a]|nr:hypothetical protein FRB93_007664 [Tulasnella sp. JGI-2019a]KAG8995380.1 hypothetical protein FRB94_009196 [Tulasnella sp. JGI-2019a]KAG9028069.1 hypothetical protein FRB95_006871 [Tulasnella sp. JGI-2019a]
MSLSCQTTIAGSITTKPITAHHTHYYADGTFCFIVQTTIFRIYQGLLTRRSEVMKDLFSIPQQSPDCSRSSSPSDINRPPAYDRCSNQQQQLTVEGVPAVILDDRADDFANLLDIIMPGRISSLPPSTPRYTFDQLAGIVRLCDKYAIDDIRDWALSWIDDILPSSIDDIARITVYWGDACLIARVITFSRTTNLLKYLPLALYTLALHQWTDNESAALLYVQDALSIEDQQRVQTGRLYIQQLLLEKAPTLPDLGLSRRTPCIDFYSRGSKSVPCGIHQQDGWVGPMELIGALLRGPLEVLNDRVEHPPRDLCNRCTLKYIHASSLLREEVYRRLPEFFQLS